MFVNQGEIGRAAVCVYQGDIRVYQVDIRVCVCTKEIYVCVAVSVYQGKIGVCSRVCVCV